jgi:hypothetical protein
LIFNSEFRFEVFMVVEFDGSLGDCRKYPMGTWDNPQCASMLCSRDSVSSDYPALFHAPTGSPLRKTKAPALSGRGAGFVQDRVNGTNHPSVWISNSIRPALGAHAMQGYECDATPAVFVVLAAGVSAVRPLSNHNRPSLMYFVIFVTVTSAFIGLACIWIWALLHCRGNQHLDRVHMERWLIFIGLTPPIGALIYLYLHRHDPMSLDMRLKH